jgi:hypothetical protein
MKGSIQMADREETRERSSSQEDTREMTRSWRRMVSGGVGVPIVGWTYTDAPQKLGGDGEHVCFEGAEAHLAENEGEVV